jgi:hypothetical protein
VRVQKRSAVWLPCILALSVTSATAQVTRTTHRGRRRVAWQDLQDRLPIHPMKKLLQRRERAWPIPANWLATEYNARAVRPQSLFPPMNERSEGGPA